MAMTGGLKRQNQAVKESGVTILGKYLSHVDCPTIAVRIEYEHCSRTVQGQGGVCL